jgi:hypothetical protein
VREDVLEERRARGEGEQLRKQVAHVVADANRAVGAVHRDVDVEPERVVAPDDPAQDLVVAAVVRRVDDPLLVPRAPGVSPCGSEEHTETVGEFSELVTPLAHAGRRVAEAFAPPGSHLDLRGDELADQVLLELRVLRGRLELLEPVRERQRLGIEDRELLLDGDGEVLRGFVRRAREPDLLVRAQPLLLTHAETLCERLEQAVCDVAPGPLLFRDAAHMSLQLRPLLG